MTKTIIVCTTLVVVTGSAYMPEDDCEFMCPFTKSPLGVERPIIVNDRIVTADEWRLITGQLKRSASLAGKRPMSRTVLRF